MVSHSPEAFWPRTPRRRLPERSLFALGLALSALIHLLILLVSPSFIGLRRPRVQPGTSNPTDAAAALPAMRVYTIAPISQAAPPVEERVARAAEQVARREEQHQPLPVRPSPPPATDVEAAGRSPVDRIAPALRDPRLWVAGKGSRTPENADVERVRNRLYGRLEALSDSVLMAEADARRALDWTLSDDDGKRWGISPDCIHLGGITIPRVVRLGRPLCDNSQSPGYLREWEAINAQATRARVRDRLNEQIKAIRERKEQERRHRLRRDDQTLTISC